MYLRHWGMTRRPFSNTHALDMFVPLESSVLALNKLRYALAAELGVVCVGGPAGVGKTELVRIVVEDLRRAGWMAGYLPNPRGSRETVMRAVGRELGAPAEPDASWPTEEVQWRLQSLADADARVCLAVDDVQTVEEAGFLEDLRLLLNVERDGLPVLNLVLAGQPHMDDLLAGTSHFDSRVAMRVPLKSFTEDETMHYVLYRLKLAGCTRGIFTRRAAEMIYQLSGGVAADVNRLCELALVTGFGLKADKIKPEVVENAGRDLGLSPTTAVDQDLDDFWAAPPPQPEPKTARDGDFDILASLE